MEITQHKKINIYLERASGIEPPSRPWEGHILPLNHARDRLQLIAEIDHS